MPELPEVETIARTLAPQVQGRVINAVHTLLPKTLEAGHDLLPGLFPGLSSGARVYGVRRRAKLLLVDLLAPGLTEPAHVMAFHLKMTGKLFVHPAGTDPFKHTRMVFDLEPAPGLPSARLFFDDARTFGYCRIMRLADLASWPFWTKLGPEPLTLSEDAFAVNVRDRRGAIKALLLDQTVIAGIGNIYADEACFRSGIRPSAPASSLSSAQLKRLLRNVKTVLQESIDECGSSIRDYRDANGDAGAFQNMFRVYGRAGQACVTCGKNLEKATIAGRTTVFCPHCQK